MRESELTEELRRLPMHHSAVAQLLAVLDNADASAREVARSLECDPSLCVRVLHLANSPYFGLQGKVGSVERAVVALGYSVIRSLAVSTAAGLFAERSDQMPESFWAHSVAVAAASSLVAQHIGVPAGDSLCAGLLHDLGAALAFRYQPDVYTELDRCDVSERLGAEDEAFGADHASLGALALEAWRLPAGIADAVRNHHGVEGSLGPVARCVIAGEALALSIAGEQGPRLHEPAVPLADALALVNLESIDVEALLDRADSDAQELGSLLAA